MSQPKGINFGDFMSQNSKQKKGPRRAGPQQSEFSQLQEMSKHAPKVPAKVQPSPNDDGCERGRVAMVRDDYGFIKRPISEPDLYFHLTHVQGRQALKSGDEVEYKVFYDKGVNQFKAKNVKLLGGLSLQPQPKAATNSTTTGSNQNKKEEPTENLFMPAWMSKPSTPSTPSPMFTSTSAPLFPSTSATSVQTEREEKSSLEKETSQHNKANNEKVKEKSNFKNQNFQTKKNDQNTSHLAGLPKERGVVKLVKDKFGFIRCPSTQKGQVFFHNNEVEGSVLPKEGDTVEFWIISDPKTGGKDFKATGVRVISQSMDSPTSPLLPVYASQQTSHSAPSLNLNTSKSIREWLKDLEEKPDPEVLLLHLDKFRDIVNHQQLSLPMIQSILTILTRPEIKESERTSKIFQITFQSSFFRNPKNLQSYILKLSASENVVENLLAIIDLLEEILDRVSNSHKDLPLESLESSYQKILQKYPQISFSKVSERLSHLLKFKQQVTNAVTIRDYEADDFRSISIFPTTEEMLVTWEEIVHTKLRPNIPKGKFDNVIHYLDTHFRLLREDCLQPLREGIRAYRNNKASRDVRVYHQVQTVGIRCGREGVVYRVSFKVEGPIAWERSKRLMYGNLICLSPDDFQTILWATVANRDVYLLAQNSQIDIRFSTGSEIDPSLKYTMVESATTYFEAYQHVLRALQQLDITKFPFVDYLVNCQTQVRCPSYLKTPDGNSADFFNFSNVFEGGKSSFSVLQNPWPNVITSMDESQQSAFKLALTKELCLIQGPPGTGKTFVGLKIMRALLDNSHLRKKGPVLVVCYTNHALDQFLEGICEFEENLVRIGSRCKSEKLKEKNLRGLMQAAFATARKEHHHTRRMINQQLEKLTREISRAVENLNLQVLDLECVKLVNPDQYESLLKGGGLWKGDLLHDWLGESPAKILDSHQQNGKSDPKQQKEESLKKSSDDLDEEEELDDEAVLQMQLERMVGEDEAYVDQQNDLMEITPFPSIPLSQLPSQNVIDTLDVWSLSYEDRRRLYKHWLLAFRQQQGVEALKVLSEKFEKFSRDKLNLEEDIQKQILEKAEVIGMTTTGVAKFHKLIQSVQPEIVLVEEAAEVLESHIIASIGSSTKHLILIGDHQQLRPSTAVYQLAKQFYLDVSLFERLVNNGMDQVTLLKQRRMRPEISKLLKPLYPQLGDSLHVLNYPHVSGVQSDVFFLDHQYEEYRDPENCSRSNQHEASFIARFSAYLMMQGYQPNQVTVLTPYFGQVRLLRQEFRKYESMLEKVRITSVDNYQGEECDIILLSLVRSNSRGEIGFLRIDNRVCVALSRAKIGFYMIGNGKMLRKETPLWKSVVEYLESKGWIGSSLTLRCQNHPQDEIKVLCEADFKLAEDGGCHRPCNQVLSCGHYCPRKCHPFSHDLIKCYKPCKKTCEAGNHPCPYRCYEECGKCLVGVEKVLPECGHKDMVMCHVPPDEHLCTKPCERLLPCGHKCDKICGKKCKVFCHMIVERDLRCGHVVKMECGLNVVDYKCKLPHAK